MRPGKPLMVGRRGNTTFIGMPGNPVASIVCSHLFLKPLIAKLSGPSRHDIRDAVLGAQMAVDDSREDYVRAGIGLDGNSLIATPFPIQDSSMLRHWPNRKDLVRPPFAPAVEAGEICRSRC